MLTAAALIARLDPRTSSAPPARPAVVTRPTAQITPQEVDEPGSGSGSGSGSGWFAGSARQLATLTPRPPYAAQVGAAGMDHQMLS